MDIYEKVFRNSRDGLFIMNDKRVVVDCNEALCKAIGRKKAEIVGETAHIFHPSKESYTAFGGKIKAESKNGDGSFTVEWCIMKKDGTIFPTEVSFTPIADRKKAVSKYVLMIRDISERKKTEKALKESEKKYRELTEDLPLGVFEADRLGNISYANETVFKLFGYEKGEVLESETFRGINFIQLVASEEREAAIDDIQFINFGRRFEVERKCLKKDGTKFPVIIKASPILSDGKAIGLRGFFLDITERKMAEEKVQYLALHDTLTGLPNRVLLSEHFNMALEGSKRNDKGVGCLMLDLDDFKVVNDSLGHRVGDLLLKKVSDRIKNHLRKVDTLARIGGDEFAIILPEISQTKKIEGIAKRLISSLEKPFFIDGNEVFVGVSIGISTYPENGNDLETLQQKADTAMYRAKSGGKNRYRMAKEESR